MELVPVFCGKDCGGKACPLLAEREGGRVLRIRHNPAGGEALRGCRRGFVLHEEHYSERRLLRPLIRTGERGSGSFREASWEEALGLVHRRLAEIRARHGPTSVLSMGGAGSMGALHSTPELLDRYLNLTGGATLLSGSYSYGAASYALGYVLGEDWRRAGADAATMLRSGLIVLWGANPMVTRFGCETPNYLVAAAARGIPMLAIDPRRSESARRLGAEWLPIRPGADAALMLALLHEILGSGRADRGAIERLSVGFAGLEDHVLGRDGTPAKDPAWAAARTGIPAARIEALGREWLERGPVFLMPGFSVQRTFRGEESFRLSVALQLASGNLGRLGGTSGSITSKLPAPRHGKLDDLDPGTNPSAPVLRWPDLVLGGRAAGFPSDIKAAYVAGSNYANQGGDLRKSARALASLEFSVAHELFPTPTAALCDVVLPAASALEKEDVGVPWLGNYLLYKPRVLPRRGGVRSDYEIFAELAGLAGVGEAYTEGRDEAGWVEAIIAASEVPDPEAFRASGVHLAPERERVGLADFAADPAGKPLRTPSGRVEIGSSAYARDTGEPPHPVWRDLPETPGHPLRLLTPKVAHRTHSQGGDRPSAVEPHRLEIHPDDARARGIGEGDEVLVSSATGRLRAVARLSEDLSRGVLSLAEGAWYELGPEGLELRGSANALTSTEPCGPSGGAVMHGIPVEAARA